MPAVTSTLTLPHLCSSATAAPSSRRTASRRCNVGKKPYVRSGRASCSSLKADSEFKPSHAVTPAPAARCHASSFSRNMPRWLSSVYWRAVSARKGKGDILRKHLDRILALSAYVRRPEIYQITCVDLIKYQPKRLRETTAPGWSAYCKRIDCCRGRTRTPPPNV